MSVEPFSEPVVLARALGFLTPSAGNSYTVVDTQFRVDEWGDRTVPEVIRERLRPTNALTLAGGHPDALVAPPASDRYRGGGDPTTAVAVLEAKGESRGSDRNADRVGITQAHAHLSEVNVAFAALPQSLVRDRSHALARELNVGLIAVDDSGVELLQTPRLVGSTASDTTETVRFHARVGGVAVENLQKNHPKNALGHALAVAHDGPTDELSREYVIGTVDHSRRDAAALGLVDEQFDRQRLTDRGRECVRTLACHYGGVEAALETVHGLKRSRTRLFSERPVLGTVARRTLLAYPPTQILIETISGLMRDGNDEPSLATVARAVAEDHPEVALDLFVPSQRRGDVLTERDRLDPERFDDADVYATHTTYQYKGLLYHAGLLTSRGVDNTAALDPTSEVWALETTVREG